MGFAWVQYPRTRSHRTRRRRDARDETPGLQRRIETGDVSHYAMLGSVSGRSGGAPFLCSCRRGRLYEGTAAMYHYVKRTTCVLMLMLGVWFGDGEKTAHGLDDPREVYVMSDTLMVYSRMSRDSEQVATLKKAETVILRFQIMGSEGSWCAITVRGMAPVTGYVPCEYLGRVRSEERHWYVVGGEGDERDEQTTNVTIIDNLILVPATVGYKGNTTEVLLLLDTGASRTVLRAEIAARLHIDLKQAKRAIVQVVGGGLVEARREKLSFLKVGPHTRTELEVAVIQHTGSAVKYDGLLGIDVLHNLSYNLDYQHKVIRWTSR
jgi:hypothetical protein